MEKLCKSCLLLKDESKFHKRKSSPDGLAPTCKECRSAGEAKFRLNNATRLPELRKESYRRNRKTILAQKKEYHSLNKEAINTKSKIWAQENREESNARRREDYSKNPEKYKKKVKSYVDRNKEKVTKYRTKYSCERNRTDIEFKLTRSLRSRMHHAVVGNQKVGSAVDDLGCSIEDFKTYISKQFKPEMTWDNYGPVWHLDHKRPLTKFALEDRLQFLEAAHFTNYQPMFKSNNVKKGNRLPKVYFVFGLFGSGKTTLVNSLKDRFHVFSYDQFRSHPMDELTNPPDFDVPSLYETPMLVGSFLKRSRELLDVTPIYLREPLEVILQRIEARKGEVDAERLVKRARRFESLARKYGAFVGNYAEVEEFLKSNQKK
jgi:hypothetical protein